MSDDAEIKALQERLGYTFKDPELLVRAVTHSSLSGGGNKLKDLERLEFLGDRVLGLLTAEALWRKYPNMKEGDLAPRLNAMVRKESCAKAAKAWNVGSALRLSEQEDNAGGRKKTGILGDACEAILGALYIDGGLPAAEGAFDLFWTPNIDALTKRFRDPKTELQEWSQAKGIGAPSYRVLNHEGPAHRPAFTVEVQVEGFSAATANGGSKRAAQAAAAEIFLVREGVWQRAD
ncbi:MAG: ribonuclease III [Pseudomonadota bacterium]